MMVTVTGTFTLPSSDAEGAPIPDSGTVRFSLASSAVLQDAPPQIVTTADVLVTLDDEGSFSVELIPSDSPLWATEDPVPYTVTLTLSTTRTRYSVLVPTSGSDVDLADLVALGSPPDVVVVPGPAPVLTVGDVTATVVDRGEPADIDLTLTPGDPAHYTLGASFDLPLGLEGTTLLNGTGAPAYEVGVEGDFWIDTANMVIYGPKDADDGWPESGTPIVGPSGGPVPSLTGVPSDRLLRTTGDGGTAWDVEIDTSRQVVPSARFMKDATTLPPATDLALTLGAEPLPYSVLVSLDGVMLAEGVDYTVTANVVEVLARATGGALAVRYAYDADTQAAPAAAETSVWAVLDTFTRADASTLGSTDTGQAWTTYLTSTWGIVSGVARKLTNGTSGSGAGVNDAATVDSGLADCEVEVLIVAPTGNSAGGITFRMSTNTSNCWRADRSGLYRLQAGVQTKISGYTSSVVSGDRMRVRAVGDTISVYKQTGGAGSWRLICGPISGMTFNATATRHGLSVSWSGATEADLAALTFDQFRVRSAH